MKDGGYRRFSKNAFEMRLELLVLVYEMSDRRDHHMKENDFDPRVNYKESGKGKQIIVTDGRQDFQITNPTILKQSSFSLCSQKMKDHDRSEMINL